MKIFPLIIVFFISQSILPLNDDIVLTGAENLVSDKLELLYGKHLGIVTNHTAVLRNGTHLVDTLLSLKINIEILFAPEHGIRGSFAAGETIKNDIDLRTSIPVFSLYGNTKKPPPESLKKVDLLLFDIQDTGARFYTYISTLFYMLQAAAENEVPIIVLDRPNPIGGIYVDGPIRKDDVKSFVGIAPIPITYGLTIGELAEMFCGEGWLGKQLKPELTVIHMRNWKREFFFDDCKIPWISPSPNITDINTAIVYPGTCLLEGTNVSEGRGTSRPFLTIGAPFIDPDELISELSNIKGVSLLPISFFPEKMEGIAPKPKYAGQRCEGISIEITDREEFESVKFGIYLISALYKLYPKHLKFNKSFNLLAGSKEIISLIKTAGPEEIFKRWQKELTIYNNLRNKYIFYKD